MSLSNNFPTIAPSLNLDFANVKALDPRITFTRTTTATYYDGKTTAKAEENLFLQSQTFETSWTATNVTVAANTGDTTAPDGTSTAEKLTITGGSAAHGVAQSLSMVVATYTVSVFAKKGTQFYLRFGRNTGTAIPAPGTWWWDVDAGTFNGTLGAGWANQSITSVGNDWYRCAVSVTTTAAGTDGFTVALTDNAGNNIFSADNNTFYVWGAQLEQRSAVSAYTPTTTQTITNYVPVLQTAASGVARFDHNPTTGESLGLLVEEQRSNLVTYSSEFDNAAWTKSNSSITANTIVAPDGTLTGDKIIEDATNNSHFIRNGTSSVSPTSVSTTSVYAKVSERTNLLFRTTDDSATGNYVWASFNLSTGVVNGSGNVGNATGASATITSVGNGWYRCVLSGTPNTSGTTTRVQIFIATGTGNSGIYTGDGYSGIFLWGAQLEAGAFPTSYIPTVAATVTRNADAASMTGTNFSSWYRADEGSFYVDWIAGQRVDFTNPFCVGGLSANVGFMNFRRGSSGNMTFSVVDGTTTQASISIVTGATVSGTTYKGAGTFKVNDFAATSNGATPGTDTSGTVPSTIGTLVIGNGWNNTLATPASNEYLGSTIKKIAFYPARLSNAQLQALTTV